MKILFTGGSSFSGTWFVRELVEAGHEVVAPLLHSTYSGLRLERVQQLQTLSKVLFDCPFGSDLFLQMIQRQNWDLLCHHAADVTDYKSPQFDVERAVERNTHNLDRVLKALSEGGCQRVVLTGTVFEPNEGAGTDLFKPVSPYGLSKGLTSEVFQNRCAEWDISLGKFVIPNPFGPYEEERFTTSLVKTWYRGGKAEIHTPDYIRDNIHITLLAKVYAQFAPSDREKMNPSGYIESQGEFTKRFAAEIGKRLAIDCPIAFHPQTEFPEPRERVNTDPIDPKEIGWDEGKAWDDLAIFYRQTYAPEASQ